MKYKVRVNYRTGHEEIDDQQGAEVSNESYEFDTKAEAEAFMYGLTEAFDFASGWLDAHAEFGMEES